ncbi:MAG: 4Fe-4S binding protein [Candidatus Bathyarchaeota archaeon]|jgi:formate hydrogenlyase subunit 6/NADH:ubiquinone oxidoreductase subunit I|nr:4Fe-4S binding protein [Candidatus Bathyarchaeota archaeon]
MKARLKFGKDRTSKPIISSVILKTRAPINILRAEIDESSGEVLIEVPDEKAKKTVEAFKEMGVEVKVGGFIELLREKCIDCGHCITVCPVEAISAKKDLTVVIDPQKCINCGACVDCCPTRAIETSQ